MTGFIIIKEKYKSKKHPKITGKKLITCEECGGLCCTHIAIPVETPKTKDDYDDIKWYLYHEKTSVFIGTDNLWYIQIELPCKKLDENGKCTIYPKRPPTCRYYEVKDCEKNVQDFSHFFGTIKDYENYCEELGIKLKY